MEKSYEEFIESLEKLCEMEKEANMLRKELPKMKADCERKNQDAIIIYLSKTPYEISCDEPLEAFFETPNKTSNKASNSERTLNSTTTGILDDLWSFAEGNTKSKEGYGAPDPLTHNMAEYESLIMKYAKEKAKARRTEFNKRFDVFTKMYEAYSIKNDRYTNLLNSMQEIMNELHLFPDTDITFTELLMGAKRYSTKDIATIKAAIQNERTIDDLRREVESTRWENQELRNQMNYQQAQMKEQYNKATNSAARDAYKAGYNSGYGQNTADWAAYWSWYDSTH